MVLIFRVKEDAVEIAGVAEGVDLPDLPWWRACRVAAVVDEAASGAVGAFLEKLRAAFAEQGHCVDDDDAAGPGLGSGVGHHGADHYGTDHYGAAHRFEAGDPAAGFLSGPMMTTDQADAGLSGLSGDDARDARADLDILLVHVPVPKGLGSLLDRVEEQYPPLMVRLRRSGDVRGRVRHLVAVFETDTPLSSVQHSDVVQTARVAMARVGAPKALFLTADPVTGDIVEATLCTLEGGHPSERDDIVRRVRDRLVSAACASEVAGQLEVVPDAVGAAEWDAARSPQALAAAGRRMGALGLLPPPHRVSDYVSSHLAAAYQRYLGVKGFSEGMMFVYDPELAALVVTASGSWDVDKRALGREDVVVVDHRLADGRLRVLSVAGAEPKGPSVEAWEVCALMAAAPTVRVSRSESGVWRLDPAGTHEVPAIRGGIHAHVGVDFADEHVIETVAPDRERFPYGFGCGTDLMVDVAAATVRRSRAVNDPTDPRRHVRWPMLYHGEMAVELWRPDSPETPLEGLLDLFDPQAAGAISFRSDHIDQPV